MVSCGTARLIKAGLPFTTGMETAVGVLCDQTVGRDCLSCDEVIAWLKITMIKEFGSSCNHNMSIDVGPKNDEDLDGQINKYTSRTQNPLSVPAQVTTTSNNGFVLI